MLFREAFDLMKKGMKVKLPSWAGYWYWSMEKQTIIMHTKNGEEMDIRETQVVDYTFSNVACDDWVLADGQNCPELGGVNTFSFGEAIKYLKRGMKVARKGWNGKGMYIFLAHDLEFKTDADLSEFNPENESECTEANQVYVHDCLVMRTADRKLQPGWIASQPDLLAEDWVFAEPK